MKNIKQSMLAILNQVLYDGLIKLEKRKARSYITRIMLRILRRWRVNNHSVVKVDLLDLLDFDKKKETNYVTIPISHDLPFIFIKHKQYSLNLCRISALVQESYPKLSFIDIGGNIGDTVYLLRQNNTRFPILSIEGDENYFKILMHNTKDAEGVFLEKVFLGDETTRIGGTISISNGTGNIIRDTSASSGGIELRRLDDVLKQWPAFIEAKMVKIDTDGFDNSIIRGMTELIVKAKPVIFFEYDPFFLKINRENALSVFQLLYSLGYCSFLIYDNLGNLLLSLDSYDFKILEDLHWFIKQREKEIYFDICAFHNSDSSLYEAVKVTETSRIRKS